MERTRTQPPDAASPAERAAAAWNLSSGVRRHGPLFARFAEAVGHTVAIRDPELFQRSFVGRWPSFDSFVSDYIEETSLSDALDSLPGSLRPYVEINRARVRDELTCRLLVLENEDGVCVFDAKPVVNSTVPNKER